MGLESVRKSKMQILNKGLVFIGYFRWNSSKEGFWGFVLYGYIERFYICLGGGRVG